MARTRRAIHPFVRPIRPRIVHVTVHVQVSDGHWVDLIRYDGWRVIGSVLRNLYHNLYHRPPTLASAHQRRIGENPLIPALTSAHERSPHI